MNNPFQGAQPDVAGFLPEDYVARKAEHRANFLSLTLFAIVMFCVVAAFFVTNRQWMNLRAEQQTINAVYTEETQKITQLKELEAQKEQMMGKAQITAALIEKVPRSVLLAELVTRMPSDLTLMSLELTSKRIDPPKPKPSKGKPGKPVKKVLTLSGVSGSGTEKEEEKKIEAPRFEFTLSIVGVASSNGDVADYLKQLKACELIDQVELLYIKETMVSELDLRKFEIEASIRPNADARRIDSIEDLRLAAPGEHHREMVSAGDEED
jgi:Tfp pilus assembly protein PilN